MIAHVRGMVVSAGADNVVVDVGGVGLELLVPGRLASQAVSHVGGERTFVTHLHVRDDALQLFGFNDARELAFFRRLITVSGVGPRVALAILSAYPVPDLELAVLQADHKRFESIPGIGRKLAQRLIVELKDSVGQVVLDGGGSVPPVDERAGALLAARSALVNLGMTLADADSALQEAPADAAVDELVRYALRRARPS